MKKGLFSALIMVTLALLIISSIPMHPRGEGINGDVQKMDQLCFVKSVSSEEKLYVNISDFNSALEPACYQPYDLIYAYYDTLNTVDSSKLVELIDNGSVICVRGNMSAEDVYGGLGLPFDGYETFVSGVTVSGMFLYNQSGGYFYGLICDAQLAEGFVKTKTDESEPAPIPIADSAKPQYTPAEEEGTFEYLDVADFHNALADFRSCSARQGTEMAFSARPYNVYVTGRRNGELVGSISITQCRGDICVYGDGGDGGGDEAITDIVSQVTVSSAQPVHLLDYNVGMHANVSNMSVIGQSYLNPQSTAGYSPSEGIGFRGNTLADSIGGETSNAFPDQNITNHFLKQKIKEWWCDPTKKWKGASWELEPAIRIRNNNASSWKNQAYTCVTDARWQKNLFVLYYIPNAIEVGGAW